jgi:type IV secretory pathway TrbD component
MLCRPFGDLSCVWLCYVGPLVILAVFGYVMWALGDLSHVWLCYVGPLLTLAVCGYVM